MYSSAPIRSGNKIIGLVVVFRDMTEHQQAQNTLRRAERLAAAGRTAEAQRIYRRLRDSRTRPEERYLRAAADKALTP
mgnify:CR=1 FL=1